jgi:hypothetical protein
MAGLCTSLLREYYAIDFANPQVRGMVVCQVKPMKSNIAEQDVKRYEENE